MERRPRSPTGRNAPNKSGPKSGLESGFRKRTDRNFSTRDGKEGFRADDKKRTERPKRDFEDRPKRDFGDKPKRSYGDKPERGGFGDKSKRSFEDRPKRDFGDKPKRDFGDKPKRSYGDKPERGGFGDKPKRSFGDRPDRGSFGDKPKRSFGDRPQRDFGDKPKHSYGDKPERGGFGDKPKRSFGDRPQKSFGDRDRGGFKSRDERPARSFGPRIEVSVYGIHAVQAALLNPEREIKAIYATEQDLPDLQPTLDQALEDGIILPDVTIVEREALNRALPRDAVHQGVGIDAKPLEEIHLQDIIRKSEVKKKSVVVLLDQVTDPHNIGAILRSACAFGADAVVVQSRNAPELNGLIAKTASGAAEHVPVIYETNLSRTIESLKEAGFFALALDERGENLEKAPAYEKTVLVMGAEGPGLRPLIKNNCDLLVKLPTSGPISSLNVSNAAAIALYAIASKA